MRFSRVLFFGIVLLMNFGFAVAQDDPTLDIGLKPYGSYHGGDLDSVNLSNGNLTLHMVLPGYPQRGNLSLTPRITYNNKGWTVVPNCNSKTGDCSPYWSLVATPGGPIVLDNRALMLAAIPDDIMSISWRPQSPGSLGLLFSATTADGSVHQLAPNQAGGMSTLDGTGIWYDGSNPNSGPIGITRDHNGNTSGGPLEDTNGNFFVLNSVSYTDTLGRGFSYMDSGAVDSSGCTGPLPIASATTSSLPGYNSGARIFKVCYAAISLKSNFQASGYYNDSLTSIADRSYTQNQIQSIVLYNGISWSTSPAWTFEYNSRDPGDPITVNYGDLTKVTLPTGGSISYTWGNVGACDPNANTPVSRGVTSRTVDANDGTGPHTWTYNGAAVTDPAGNDTVHTFTALNGSCSFYETKTQYFQGSYQSGHLLKMINTDYQWIANPFDFYNSTGTLHTVTNVFPIRVTTTLPNGKVTKVEKDYDTNLVYFDPVHGWMTASFGNVIEEREFDYGNGAPGSLLRRTDYTYKAFDGSGSAASYRAANLISLISSITTYDGNNNMVAQTKYGYDESSLQSSGLTSQQQHDTTVANPGVRGNRTSASHWLNTTGGMITSTVTYYDTGTPYQMTDPLGHITTDFYGTGFQSGTNFIGAYVTQTQNALQQNALFDYDFGTGLRTGLKDANGQVTNWSYDFLNRTLQVNAPDGGNTSLTYNDVQPPTFTASTTIIGQTKRGVEGDIDGLGRAIHTKLTTDPEGVDTVDTTYDSLGRVATVSNPHRAGSSSTDGITTSTYDALGRTMQTTRQDGSISSVKYNVVTTIAVNGDCTITTDEAGNQRGACTDALGRLVEVDEPNPGTTPTISNYATMQTDGNFVLYSPSNSALWSSGTSGSGAGPVMMQDDGNLVIYIFKWSAGTYAAPSPGPFPPATCSIGAYLVAGETIPSGKCIASPHGQYFLYMSPDGNFYIYDYALGQASWGANTYGHPGAYALLQMDGNFVVNDVNGVTLWSSGTGGSYAERLDMEDDGRIIIYKSAWNSQTSTGQFNWTQLAHPGCDVGTGTGATGVLGAGQCFVSPNGHFELLLQTDGNMVIYDLGVTPANLLWSTNTTVSPADPGYALRTLYTYDSLGNLTCVEQHGGVTTGTGCSAAPSNDASSPWRVRRFTYDSLGRLLTAKNPESGTISYTYDNDGNLLQKTSPAPNQTNPAVTQTISYCYDALHRVTGKAYSAQTCQNGQLPVGTAVVSYTYDQGTNGVGHLTSLTDQAGTGTYTYDPMGRIASEQRTIAGISKSMSYSYNLDGSLKTATYPSNTVITYTPGGAGRMLSAVDTTNTINYVTGATYTPDGSLDGFVSGKSGTSSGITNLFSYNPRLQPCRMTASTGALPTNCTDTVNHGNVLDLAYDFHAGSGNNGNVYGLTNYKDSSRNQTFTYDSLDRLTSAQNAGTNCAAMTANGKTEYWGNNYSYDAWGNLLQKSVTKCSAENAVLTINSNNQALYYSYDAAGNMINDGIFAYNFDQENRLTSANGYTYAYDGDGNRVKKSNGSTGTLYWYMTPGVVAETDLSGNNPHEYIFFNGERVARKDSNGLVYYYFSNHLKTASVITDSSGNIRAESDYYPWGGELQLTANDSNHYKFSGKERDAETGLDYFGARYYSNALGRFMSADWAYKPSPVPYAELADPQSLNLYSFVRNVPTARFDKDGHKDCSASGANCTQVSSIQINQTVNLYEDSKNPNKVTGTVQVTTTITVIYGGSAQQTSITARATVTNVGNTHYSTAQLGIIGNTVAAVQAQGVTKSLGSDPARLLTATVARESTFGITSPTNPLQLACSSGQCASRGDTAGNIDRAENILSDRVHSQHDNPARTYDRYNAAPNHVTNTQRFMNSYSTMQQGLAGTTYTGPALPVPDGLK